MISDKFHPAYNKFGKWYFSEENMTMKDCNLWFQKHNVKLGYYTTTLIVNNCDWCPKWSKILYVKYELNRIFKPEKKD